ncbi:MAG TPA: NINE protein [Pyrinomonadaceae bacterium]|nr:NINE protein [Pyrinomonadaceae bacterium]
MLPISPMPMQQVNYGQKIPGADKKIAAGLCGILLGGLGIHKFILGYQQEGIIYLAMFGVAFILAFLTCGIGSFLLIIPGVLGLIEGIIYLTKSDEEFVQTYVIGKKPWF